MNVSQEVAALKEELIQLRRDFHKYPELGLAEFKTSENMSAYLKQCGLEVKQVNKTGVVGILWGGEPDPYAAGRHGYTTHSGGKRNSL